MGTATACSPVVSSRLSGGAPGAVATAGRSRTVHVQSQNRWTDTGIDVRAGQTVTLDASGTIQMSDNAQDTAIRPDRRRAVAHRMRRSLINSPARWSHGSATTGRYLSAIVASFNAPVSGRLYFGVNDDHLPDNKGEFIVNVTTQ